MSLLAEVTGNLPLVVLAIFLVAVYGVERLADRESPEPEVIGLD